MSGKHPVPGTSMTLCVSRRPECLADARCPTGSDRKTSPQMRAEIVFVFPRRPSAGLADFLPRRLISRGATQRTSASKSRNCGPFSYATARGSISHSVRYHSKLSDYVNRYIQPCRQNGQYFSLIGATHGDCACRANLNSRQKPTPFDCVALMTPAHDQLVWPSNISIIAKI